MKPILDLGSQPVPNTLLDYPSQSYDEFPLIFGFDEDLCLAGLVENIPSELMYNDKYSYSAGASAPTVKHFKEAAEHLVKTLHPTSVLEIGSNDGTFIKNFPSSSVQAVEPCGNFAEMTNEMGYQTLHSKWSYELAKDMPKFDLVYAANCLTHIEELEDAFRGLAEVVADGGYIVLEEPWLLDVIKNVAYDQIYFEHSYIFSAHAVRKLANRAGLNLVRTEELPGVHGGSLRYYLSKTQDMLLRVDMLLEEKKFGLHRIDAYEMFAERVGESRTALIKMFDDINGESENRIMGYGATAKSVTVMNYCGLTSRDMRLITDTTPAKQNKFSPGSDIPIVAPVENLVGFTHAFLGAWNFEKQIVLKEKAWLEQGGRFITHVPHVRVIGGFR